MKSKVILFDIDGTIFDPHLFINNFQKKIVSTFNLPDENIDEFNKLREKTKAEKGYFFPDLFLTKISNKYCLDKTSVEELFWDKESLEKSLFSDWMAIKEVAKFAKIAIFSKGNFEWQNIKLNPFRDLVGSIHIFPNKIEKLRELTSLYRDLKIYIIDDEPAVLEEAKRVNPTITTILINREKKTPKNDKIDATVENLFEILPLINE